MYQSCQAWTEDVDLSNATKEEERIFIQSNTYQKVTVIFFFFMNINKY